MTLSWRGREHQQLQPCSEHDIPEGYSDAMESAEKRRRRRREERMQRYQEKLRKDIEECLWTLVASSVLSSMRAMMWSAAAPVLVLMCGCASVYWKMWVGWAVTVSWWCLMGGGGWR